jgi:glycosyltransferase involved in cell wall biosynthesis
MDWQTDCAAVIPCLNEAGAIGPLVQAVREHLPTVIVIDDGSTDETSSAAKRAGARVLRHDLSSGKGAALRSGWSSCHQGHLEWALSLDGDGQHNPADIPLFFKAAEQSGARLVVGDRMGDSRPMPWLRRTVNRWMSRRLSRAAGQAFPDSQCGFRLMHLQTWSQLPIRSSHFEIESEVLLAFARHGLKIQFVPIHTIYKREQTKIHPLWDTIRWWKWWLGASR